MDRACILVADDDSHVRRLVGITLDNDDFQVTYAEDGPEAVRVARETQPRLVLLDQQMPGLSGVEVCRALRGESATARTPIVMLTGELGAGVRARAFEAGATDFLTKPFSPLTLEEKVRTILATTPNEGDHAHADPPSGDPSPLSSGEGDGGEELSRAQLMLYASDLNRSMRELRRAHADLRQAYLATIETLATALELRDAETRGHCQRVTVYTVAAAEHIGIRGEALEQVRWGSVLHDVGKIGVPDAILLKPGKLLPEEWELMKQHPELG